MDDAAHRFRTNANIPVTFYAVGFNSADTTLMQRVANDPGWIGNASCTAQCQYDSTQPTGQIRLRFHDVGLERRLPVAGFADLTLGPVIGENIGSGILGLGCFPSYLIRRLLPAHVRRPGGAGIPGGPVGNHQLARRAGINHELVVNLVVYCALAGLLGAKLLMFIFDWDHFSKNPADMFSIATLRAAGVYQGGLILAVATAFWYVRRHGMPWLQTFDVFAPGIAIGHAIGKVGCFAAGCCWGKECDLPWAVTFRNPDANALTGVPLHVSLHPGAAL